jgi:hypothetical protein
MASIFLSFAIIMTIFAGLSGRFYLARSWVINKFGRNFFKASFYFEIVEFHSPIFD